MNHSKDVVLQRDFALITTGGRVIDEWTSPRWLASNESKLIDSSLVPKYLKNDIKSEHVLFDQLTAGRCWCFPGSKGTLGVQLSEPIIVTDITIDHVAPELVGLGYEAPRDIVVWAILEAHQIESLGTCLIIIRYHQC